MSVVGVYEPPAPGDPFWHRRQPGRACCRPAGPDRQRCTRGRRRAHHLADDRPRSSGWRCGPTSTSRSTWRPWRSTGWGALAGATKRVDAAARTIDGSAVSEIPALLASVESQRDQARTVIPLLAVQLAVLGAVVLTFVCAAATEQRRPEIALARLRGNRAQGAAAMILRELGLLVTIGAVLGIGLGWLAAEVATRLWLEPGVELEARLTLLLAFAGSLAVGLLAIVAAGWPTVRQPLTSLLRRVPQRASALQVGLVEGAVVAAAAAGLVTALSGDGGPVALLAPGLLAIAGGLLLTQVAVAAAGPAATRAMRTGRLTWGLTGLQIARRPALRRQTAIITVACALAVFAVDAWVVAERARVERSARDAGAAVVLGVDANTPKALRDAMLDIDPGGKFATPVVRSRSATETGPRTTAVEPEAFSRIAQWGKTPPTPAQLRTLRPERVPPVPLPDGATRVAVTTSFSLDPLPRPFGVRGTIKPFSLRLGLASADGESVLVDMGTLREGTHTYTADINCDGCTLSQFFLDRFFGDSYPADVELKIEEVEAGTPETSSRWTSVRPPPSPGRWCRSAAPRATPRCCPARR